MSRFLDERYSGLDPYVPGEQPQDRSYVKLNTNESPFPPSPRVIAAIGGEEAEKLNLYSDPTATTLVRAIAKRFTAVLQKKGLPGISEKQVFVGNGSDEVLAFAFGAFCGKGRGVAFPEIGYGFYPVFAQFFSLDATPVPVKEDMSVDAAAFKGLSQTVVIANPNAQTGIYLPLSDIETLLSENKDRLVIVDEAYCDFGAESAVGLVGRYDNLLVVQTMSKSRQLAGGRVGFAIGSEEVIADLNAMKFSFNPYNLNRLSILAGAAAVEDEEYFLSATAAVIEERERLKKEFGKLGFESTPSLANFLLVRRGGIGGRELYLALKQKGVLVRWLGGRLSDYVRITVGSREQNDVLIAAVREILKEKSI